VLKPARRWREGANSIRKRSCFVARHLAGTESAQENLPDDPAVIHTSKFRKKRAGQRTFLKPMRSKRCTAEMVVESQSDRTPLQPRSVKTVSPNRLALAQADVCVAPQSSLVHGAVAIEGSRPHNSSRRQTILQLSLLVSALAPSCWRLRQQLRLPL
jgi:hypothetical protein